MTDTAKSSWITDHPYRPRDQWWSLCGHPGCRMAEAAHAETMSLESPDPKAQSAQTGGTNGSTPISRPPSPRR